ncbi:unnamed protein product [Acidocella sp. C78]|uniref:DUF5666 domain-containing protein n=1 Tax=Acidocella sp. C78 TaxID=1671486 RepID=UPI00191BC646|nr:DUF5666 domain-containing protein [Acidocella sp. C78]CAG4915635.1 unnamed protein product [Acidocella sp. C78]
MTVPEPTAPRRKRWRLALLLAVPLGTLPGLAGAQETGGIGGTGIRHDTGGIGGTGIGQETGGIGGTGIGRTGAPIVGYGPIQRFGSVFVNNREYRITAGTLVTIDGQPATAAALRVGDMAIVHGVAEGAHGGIARSIATWQAIIGPVTHIAANGREITVLRQTVLLPRPLPGAALHPGQMVGISAQRQTDGNWVASRVNTLPASHGFRLETTLGASPPGQARLGGLVLTAKPGMLAGLHQGERVIATGRVIDGQPVLAALVPRPLRLGTPGTRVEAVNFFRSTGSGRLVAADGMAVKAPPGAHRFSGLTRVEVIGELSEAGEITATELTPELPEPPETGPSGGKPGEAGPPVHTAAPPAHHLEPPEVGEAPEAETVEDGTPEIEIPNPQTPEPDIDAPEIEPPSDQ